MQTPLRTRSRSPSSAARKLSDHVERAELCCVLLSFLDVELSAEFPYVAAFPVPLRELAGDEQETARRHARDVVRSSYRAFGELEA